VVICHIWDADYPWDVRVEKVCESLAKKHAVHLLCRNRKRRPRYERAKNLHIHRLPSVSDRWGRLNDIIGFPAFCNPLWIYHVWQIVRSVKANVIIVRDLPLALTAIGIGRIFHIPVILDMAENYPAMIQDLWDRDGFSVGNFLVRNPAIIRLVERASLRWCDHVLVVVEESRDRLLASGVPSNRISLVINTPTSARWVDLPDLPSGLVVRGSDSLTLVYLGLLEWPRGVETAIRAMPLIKGKLPGAHLIIVGSGRHEEVFRQLVRELEIQTNVSFLGWLDYASAIRVIIESDIGLVPHYATESWNTTVPNKLFDYMSMGKPVIVSNAKPTERIVQQEQCGVVFQEKNAQDLARAVFQLRDSVVRKRMGQNGYEAIKRIYNWSVDEERLLRALDITVQGRA
jgi:glycosyltransferase involved in cell wall biosynthesis